MEEIIKSFGVDWKIILAAVFNFLIVLWVIHYFLNKKVFSVLEERKDKIKKGIEKFKESEGHLKNAKDESKNIIREANILSDKKIQKAKELAEEKKNEILKEAKELSEKEKKTILEKAQEDREKIVSSAKNDIAEMALLQAEKILFKK